MSFSIRLNTIKCVEEINEASASEEVYVLITSVSLQPSLPGLPSIHNLRVNRYGIWNDFDEGEVKGNAGSQFWGLNSIGEDIANPNNVVFVVSLLENDNGDPETYRVAVETIATSSLAATIGEVNNSVRADRLILSIRDALNGINLPIPLALDDDHIGTELLRLDSSDLIPAGSGDKILNIKSEEGNYELAFRIIRLDFDVFGTIGEKWKAMGCEASPVGLPVTGEQPTFDSIGRRQNFQGGMISWRPETGAFAVWGLIGARWLEIGGEQFGYPVTDETPTPDGRGRFNHFRAFRPDSSVIGDSSIYWLPETGAHEVFGAIRDKWASMGWETSPLGYPITAEEDFQGGRIQRFQGGALFWTPQGGVVVQ
jgi:hypothetical protein